ncbi:hypothetical protein [Clostridium scatologenes]|uniref:Antirestriction protein (ArdA) n=1 Tax=Clostridium scatologenes TaxID=1548 RepID=A0A0E3K307_CLOSL|nr:hypothetical protein [Clostridium scatologenes]AKA70862.1 hypothetical protein CSCA_3737 [Clostridium scatologenes]
MNISNNTSIIGKFVAKEIEMTYRRYNEIPQEEIDMVSEFIEKLERNKVELEPYLSYNTTKVLAEACKDIKDGDLINFYVFVRCGVGLDLDIEKVKDAYERLKDYGYVELNCYYIYYKHREDVMKKIAEDELNDKLYDADYITAMYNEEELADMWIFGTTKEEAAKQYLIDNDWWKVIESEEPIAGYNDSNSNEIYYCYAGR